MTSDPGERALFLETFRVESEENLAQMEAGLLRLESAPEDEETLNLVFRAVHTMKANASALYFDEIVEFLHGMEDQLDRLRKRRLPVTAPIISVLLQSVDAIRDLMERSGVEARKSGGGARAHVTSASTLRVSVAKLDEMLVAVGEIAVARARLARHLEDLGGPATAALDVHRDEDRRYLDLQRLVLQARLVRMESTFRPLARVVRDTARASGKQVTIVLEGGEVEVDTRIAERLRDPLTHMVRNAVDHGIESPEVRRAIGKASRGTIRLVARHAHGNIWIELSDDGGGLERTALLERARAMGLVGASEHPAPERVDRLIFEPGLSTAKAVTSLSGRGVGMDVVLREVEALGGEVSVTSDRGKGTIFRLRAPLTVAIIDGFAVDVGGDVYVMPLAAVLECVESPRAWALSDEDCLMNLRGTSIPCISLRRFFGVVAPPSEREHIVVTMHEGRRVGLIVDHLFGNRQTIVKPLGRLFQGIPGVSGSAIWGDGRVALIVDVPALLRSVQARDERAAARAVRDVAGHVEAEA